MISGILPLRDRAVPSVAARSTCAKPFRLRKQHPTKLICLAAAAGLFATSSIPAAADPLTFDEALEVAEATAPQLRASALGVEAASAAAGAAGKLGRL